MSVRPEAVSGQNRREFVAGSSAALAIGSVAFTSGLSPAAPAAGFHVAGRDTVRIGLIGCGGRGRAAAIESMGSTAANVELACVGDTFESRVAETLHHCETNRPGKVKVPDSQRFTGLDAWRHVLDSDVDLVMLATPPGFRPQHFEAAIDAGKHVFMEKPVAVDGPGVRRVLKASALAQEKKLAVAVGLQRRHERAYRDTIARLQDGEIGDLLLARVYWNQGSLWVNQRAEGESELSFQLRNWLYFNWLSGDHIVEQHIHNLDVINWLMNDYPVSARGMGGRQVRLGPHHGQIFDHHMVEYDYAGGLKMISQCRQIPDCWDSVSEWVHGTKGSCEISAARFYDLKGKLVSEHGLRESGHELEQLDLIESLAAGVIPNEGEYGAKSTLTAILGRLATYTGKPIAWEKALNSGISLANTDALLELANEAPVLPGEDGEYPVPVPGESIDNHIDWDPDAA